MSSKTPIPSGIRVLSQKGWLRDKSEKGTVVGQAESFLGHIVLKVVWDSDPEDVAQVLQFDLIELPPLEQLAAAAE